MNKKHTHNSDSVRFLILPTVQRSRNSPLSFHSVLERRSAHTSSHSAPLLALDQDLVRTHSNVQLCRHLCMCVCVCVCVCACIVHVSQVNQN